MSRQPLNNHPQASGMTFGLLARLFALVALLILILIVVFFMTRGDSPIAEPDLQRRYLGRDSCIACHQEQADLFAGSHHDKAMDVATDETVLGDFSDQKLEHFGITSRLFRDGDRFMVNTEGPNGTMQDFEVKYVFGVEPLQQYMVELKPAALSSDISADASTPGYSKPLGRIQVLRISWDVAAGKWFYLMPPDVKTKIDPGDPLHWTGFTQCWNTSCAECHSTDLQKNFDHHTGEFATTFSEIDVSCEACHGPGSLHVHLAENDFSFPHAEHGYGLARLKTESNVAQIESCAPCHSRRSELTDTWHAGDRYDDQFNCTLLTTGVYHADGQIRDEDYVYGSFLQSKMFHNGIRCTDCHDPHSTRVKFPDNQLCTSCHQHPAGKYDSISHHHHTPGTPGASCVECHMPATTYMHVDARRDHSFRIPRPDISVEFGTPNACSACHLDKQTKPAADSVQYLDWIVAREGGNAEAESQLKTLDADMARAFSDWYPEGSSSVPRTKYYAQLTAGRSDDESAEAVLSQLAIDGSAPAIVRATALEQLAIDGDATAIEDALAVAIKAAADPDPKVVTAAVRVLETQAARLLERIQYSRAPDFAPLIPVVRELSSLLEHDSRLVRIESARVLTALPQTVREQYSTQAQKRNFAKGVDELIQSMLVSNDRAASHVGLGAIYESLNQPDRAAESYRTAIRIDPNMTGPRSNLAAFLDRRAQALSQQLTQHQQGTSSAESAVRQIGQLTREAERMRAEDHELLRIDLKRAAGLPGIHGLHYRFAMSSYLQGDMPAVEEHLLLAIAEEPDAEPYLLALATFYVQEKRIDEAAARVSRLLELDPENPGYRALAKQIAAEKNAP